jgi:hypothetical protein
VGLSDNDWVYDTAQVVHVNPWQNKKIPSPTSPCSVTLECFLPGTPLVAHGIGTVRIATESSEILVAEVHYALDATANLVSGFMLRWSGYSIREGPDFTFQITKPNSELAAFPTLFPRGEAEYTLRKASDEIS